MAEKRSRTIEENMRRLEEIGVLMARTDLKLEESFKLYNEGIKLVKDCHKQLSGVEKQIKVLEEQEDGDE